MLLGFIYLSQFAGSLVVCLILPDTYIVGILVLSLWLTIRCCNVAWFFWLKIIYFLHLTQINKLFGVRVRSWCFTSVMKFLFHGIFGRSQFVVWVFGWLQTLGDYQLMILASCSYVNHEPCKSMWHKVFFYERLPRDSG